MGAQRGVMPKTPAQQVTTSGKVMGLTDHGLTTAATLVVLDSTRAKVLPWMATSMPTRCSINGNGSVYVNLSNGVQEGRCPSQWHRDALNSKTQSTEPEQQVFAASVEVQDTASQSS